MTVVSVDFMATKIIALVLLSIEVKSMDESFVVVKGYSFIDRIKSVVLKMKNVRKQF